jgi:hypothetical protein
VLRFRHGQEKCAFDVTSADDSGIEFLAPLSVVFTPPRI